MEEQNIPRRGVVQIDRREENCLTGANRSKSLEER